MMLSRLAPLAIAAALWGTAAQASFTLYTSEASFLAALSTTGTDTFDDLDFTPFTGPVVRTAGTFGYTAAVGPESADFYAGSDDGTDFFLSTNNRLDTVSLTGFTGGATAVGGYFFGSDLFGFSTSSASITVTATDSDGALTQILLTPDTGTYLGFVSTGGLSSLSFSVGDQAGVWPSLDNLTFGAFAAGVPEPATWALMIVGFGLVGTSLRRRVRLAA